MVGVRYAKLDLEVIQAALALTKQEGDLVSLDLASFEVFYLRYYSEVLVPCHSVKALRFKTWAFRYQRSTLLQNHVYSLWIKKGNSIPCI
jgi:hypothetical protein